MVGRIPIVETRLDMIYTYLDASKTGVLSFENLSNALGYEVLQQNIMMQNMKMIIQNNHNGHNGGGSNGGMNERSLSRRLVVIIYLYLRLLDI